MQPTPIKINKPSASGSEPTKPAKSVLNLNGSPARPRQNSQVKKYFWLLLALIMLESAAIIWLYLAKPISPYFKILPRDLVFSSYFNQSSLLGLLKANQTSWPPLNWGAGALQDSFKKAQIEQPEQILKLFKDQMALAILLQTTDETPIWLALASIKAPADVFSQARDKAEQSLKQNYNLISESYRQIKISQIKPLEQSKNGLFYAQANGYFILTNNSALIKTTIDKIIN